MIQNMLQRWLQVLMGGVILLVVIGGLTRLNDAGLSMVDWHPIHGVLPPITEQGWQAEYLNYQTSPQYQQNKGMMSLGYFKEIFLWEYAHRMLARLLGVLAVGMFVYSAMSRKYPRALLIKLAGVPIGVALQGVLGWWMVQSGLVEIPQVSHLRLAAHLFMALALFVYLQYLYLESSRITQGDWNWDWAKNRAVLGFVGLIILQIVFGVFLAGLDGGMLMNTWPKMGAQWVSDSIALMNPYWKNLVYNPFMIQWVHRYLPYLILGYCLYLFRRYRDDRSQIARIRWVGILIFIQSAVGIFTLLYRVPISLASLHQLLGTATLLLSIQIYLLGSRKDNNA